MNNRHNNLKNIQSILSSLHILNSRHSIQNNLNN
jgi:hypothetical protein